MSGYTYISSCSLAPSSATNISYSSAAYFSQSVGSGVSFSKSYNKPYQSYSQCSFLSTHVKKNIYLHALFWKSFLSWDVTFFFDMFQMTVIQITSLNFGNSYQNKFILIYFSCIVKQAVIAFKCKSCSNLYLEPTSTKQ